jgi:hypothetical protein
MGDQAAAAMLALLRGDDPVVDLPGPMLVVRASTRRID